MSLESELSEHFAEHEFTWKIKGGEPISPSETDVLDALDEAARMLYGSPDGSQLEVGRLIIKKAGKQFDVYALFGTYT